MAHIHKYKIFDLAIEFEEPFDHFERTDCSADFNFCIFNQEEFENHNRDKFRHTYTASENGKDLVKYSRLEAQLLIEVLGTGKFVVDTQVGELRAYLERWTSKSDAISMLLSHILPIYLSTTQKLTLHGATLVSPSGIVGMIAGDKGRGKSTFTHSSFEHGFHFLSDDTSVCQLEDGIVNVVPSFPEVRLGQELMLDGIPILGKTRVPRREFYLNTPRKLDVVLMLTDSDSAPFEIRKLDIGSSVSALLSQSFKFDPYNKMYILEELKRIEQFLLSVPVYEVRGYREMTLISKVLEWIDKFGGEEIGCISGEEEKDEYRI